MPLEMRAYLPLGRVYEGPEVCKMRPKHIRPGISYVNLIKVADTVHLTSFAVPIYELKRDPTMRDPNLLLLAAQAGRQMSLRPCQ